ncbi:hypothetical protein K502DRAFT_291205 [Neoconidiobolus thromboides FSU 785]|nr:hypothetical protein K502DRAFT_291205 [Neoconidiobolus thromboides FSU 785]
MSENTKLVSKRRIQDLVSKINPLERMDPDAEDILLEIADEFIESVVGTACRLAKHRKTQNLEVKDVQLHLERNWNIRIPGFASEEIRTIRKPNISNSYIGKVGLINNAKNSKQAQKENTLAAIQASLNNATTQNNNLNNSSNSTNHKENTNSNIPATLNAEGEKEE